MPLPESAARVGQPAPPAQPLLVGRVSGCYGVRGWVRLQAFTEAAQTLQSFEQLWLRTPTGLAPIKLISLRAQGKGLVAQLEGIEDRTQAERLRGAELIADEAELPAPAVGEYYWRQLEGLSVWCTPVEAEPGDAAQAVLLGRVHHLLETGANDVLVVRPCAGSIDERERLLPYLPGEVVTAVDLAAGAMAVRWYPEA